MIPTFNRIGGDERINHPGEAVIASTVPACGLFAGRGGRIATVFARTSCQPAD